MSDKKYTLQQYAAIQGGHEMPKEKTGLTFMQTLGEAKMFKSRDQIERQGARVLTDHLFTSIMALYVMSNDYNYAPVAKKYAAQTLQLGNFNRPSPGGTDLYQTLYSVKRPELFSKEADTMLMGKVNVNDTKIKQFLKSIQSGNVNQNAMQAFLYKLERDLKIQDPKLRAARRLVQDWSKLSTQQQQLAASQIVKHFRNNAQRSDLMPLFMKFTKDNKLNVGSSKKAKIAKTIARKAAAGAGGYALGKWLLN